MPRAYWKGYPPQGRYEEYEGLISEHARALKMIPKVRLPGKDPVYGAKGPLRRLWVRTSGKRR